MANVVSACLEPVPRIPVSGRRSSAQCFSFASVVVGSIKHKCLKHVYDSRLNVVRQGVVWVASDTSSSVCCCTLRVESVVVWPCCVLIAHLIMWQPSPFSQGGVDPLASDRLGKLTLTRAGLRSRNHVVYKLARDAQIPLVITVSIDAQGIAADRLAVERL